MLLESKPAAANSGTNDPGAFRPASVVVMASNSACDGAWRSVGKNACGLTSDLRLILLWTSRCTPRVPTSRISAVKSLAKECWMPKFQFSEYGNFVFGGIQFEVLARAVVSSKT